MCRIRGKALSLFLALSLVFTLCPAVFGASVLQDGNYYVDIALWNEVLDQASMGGVAFKNNSHALVTVSGGKVTTVEFATNPVDVGVYHSGIIDFRSDAVAGYHELETGTLVTAPANQTYSYVKRAAFTLPDEAQPSASKEPTYVKVQFLVPDTPMGNGFMTARLKFTWSSATATAESHLTANEATARGTSQLTGEEVVDIHLEDLATGICLDADTDRLSDTAQLSVTEVTGGTGFDDARTALAAETSPWKLYQVLTRVDGTEAAPKGQVKLSFLCTAEPKVYRINEGGTKVPITGEYKDGCYVLNTSRLGLFAVVGGVFTDVPSSAYYAPAVTWALRKMVTNGTSETTFAPGDTVTRGQAVTFLWRAMGQPEPASTYNPFQDVHESDYFYKAVLWAVEQGITNGTSETTYDPGTPVKRNQMVTFLWRTMGRPEQTGSGTWYDDAVNWANGRQLLDGTAEAYSHEANCPRCDVVTYLWRVLR